MYKCPECGSTDYETDERNYFAEVDKGITGATFGKCEKCGHCWIVKKHAPTLRPL